MRGGGRRRKANAVIKCILRGARGGWRGRRGGWGLSSMVWMRMRMRMGGMGMRMKKMQTLFSLLFAFVCEVGGGRVCAEGGK